METKRIAYVDFFVLHQFTFNSHRSDRQKTLATDRVYGAIFVVPVGECGFRLVGHRAPRSVTMPWINVVWLVPVPRQNSIAQCFLSFPALAEPEVRTAFNG